MDQLWQDILALISAIQSHSVAAIIVAAIAIVSIFSSQVGAILSTIWSFVSGLFKAKQ